MKKKILFGLVAFILCVSLVGCTKEEKKEEKKEKDWIIDIATNEPILEDDIQKAYDTAIAAYKESDLKPVAIIGKQIVAGTNYMFLTRNDKEYKVLILYKDLQGNATITNSTVLDIDKYIDKNTSLDGEQLSGGWQTEIPGKPFALEEKVQNYFDKAMETLMGASYYPIATVGHQDNSGTDYAIISYGRYTDQNATSGVFLIRLHVDKNNNPEIKSISAMDIKDFNK